MDKLKKKNPNPRRGCGYEINQDTIGGLEMIKQFGFEVATM